MSKNTVAVPTSMATTISWARVRTPAHQATGMLSSNAARTRSARSISVRRRIRSTHTPAGSPMTRKATVSAAVSSPIWNGVAASTVAASSGITVCPANAPTWLAVSPAQRRRKSAWKNRESLRTPPPWRE